LSCSYLSCWRCRPTSRGVPGGRRENRTHSLYEHTAFDNNATADDATLQVSLKPRPDLQVKTITAPSQANAGGTIAVEFVVINQGTVGTTTPRSRRGDFKSSGPVLLLSLLSVLIKGMVEKARYSKTVGLIKMLDDMKNVTKRPASLLWKLTHESPGISLNEMPDITPERKGFPPGLFTKRGMAIDALIRQLSFRRKGLYGMIGEIGHFSGLIEFGNQVLALTTDGVGTKMLIAEHLKNWRTIGIDCIAMNVNDLYVMNIEPVAFVDYIATNNISEIVMSQIGEGLNEGARQANINIVGGETATLKGLVNGLDLAGTCLGIQTPGKIITGEKITPGDQVVGISSNGIHSNGLTLARRIVEKSGIYEQS
jgi:hypothetical protein